MMACMYKDTSLIWGISVHIRSYEVGIFDLLQANKFSHSVPNTCPNFSILSVFVYLFVVFCLLFLLFVCLLLFFFSGERGDRK